MELADDQREVVEICSGSHLVLAPPGSGKTEMLSQRILRAVKDGVDPAKMLCATFTNRAAFEMRDRVKREGESCSLPDVGNLHHFCHRFLVSEGRLSPRVHVLDEGEQLDFVREVVDNLRYELASGDKADIRRLHGVQVLKSIKGMVGKDGKLRTGRVELIRGLLDSWFAECHENGCSPYPNILSASLVVRKHRVGVPRRFVPHVPAGMSQLDHEGVIGAVEKAYTALKRKFHAVDFDDLMNETYSYLEHNPVAEERKYSWVQIDEVQDLNPLQWQIVKSLTSGNAVSVYFGDAEQSIFSFLGASESRFAEAVRGCERHYFRKNFRATPLLLEILMRYSISTLRSDWTFLPQPSDVNRPNGMVGMSSSTDLGVVVSKVARLLESGGVENVALLVKRNVDADQFEERVRSLGCRYAKVSGIDLFTLRPMRDFMAFLSLFAGMTPRTAWARLLRRFVGIGFGEATARYFVRGMYASGFDPRELLEEGSPVPLWPRLGNRRSFWAWRNRRVLFAFRRVIKPMYESSLSGGGIGFRKCFEVFASMALRGPTRYRLHELWPERFGTKDDWRTEELGAAVEHVRERMEKFLRYVDHVYAYDRRSFRDLLLEDWGNLSRMKEADLLVGDERVVISTVHKAKGRQFDAVIVPNVSEMLNGTIADVDEARRLLYVAMSRAKRHLFLYGCREDEAALEATMGCFQSGYEGYYVRKFRGDDLGADWLSSWEEMARCCREGDFRQELVDRMLASEVDVLVRMALKVVGIDPDVEHRRRKLLALTRRAIKAFAHSNSQNSSAPELHGGGKGNVEEELQSVPALGSECWDVLIDVMRGCDMIDGEAISLLRELNLAATSRRVSRVFFEYLSSGLERTRVDSECSKMDFERKRLLLVLGDCIYSQDGNLRFDAAMKLFDFGCGKWFEVVHGVNSDYERIAGVDDPEHESIIRQLISATNSKEYQRSLRAIIKHRALRY